MADPTTRLVLAVLVQMWSAAETGEAFEAYAAPELPADITERDRGKIAQGFDAGWVAAVRRIRREVYRIAEEGTGGN